MSLSVIKYSEYFGSDTDTDTDTYTISDINLYGLLTCLAVTDPKFYDFLDNERNRYVYNNSIFINDALFRLNNDQNKKIIYDTESYNLLKNSKIDIESDKGWDFLNSVRKAGLEILTTVIDHSMIESVICNYRTNSFIINNTHIFEPTIMLNDNNDISLFDLGIKDSDVYNEEFDSMINTFIKTMVKHLKPEYKSYYNQFYSRIEQDKNKNDISIDFNLYSTYMIPGIGLRVDNLNMKKLYYNNYMEFIIDLSETEDGFEYYNNFKTEWLNIKNQLLNNNILIPIINNSLPDYDKIIKNIKRLKDYEYNSFDSDINIINHMSLERFKSEYSMENNEPIKFFINSKKTLGFIKTFESFSIKILIGFDTNISRIAPGVLTTKQIII